MDERAEEAGIVDEFELHVREGAIVIAPVGMSGFVVLDQLRTVDRERLVKRLGRLSAPSFSKVLAVLQEMFAP